MLEQFTTVEEMKIFCTSQAKQIQNLSKENKELKEKLTSVPKISPSGMSVTIGDAAPHVHNLNLSLDDAKTISQIQLNMLKQIAFDRELTTNEAKRVEIYNKILTADPEKKEKPLKADIEILKEADLLKLVTNE